MAVTAITTLKPARNALSDAISFTAIGADGATVAIARDEHLLILCQNADSSNDNTLKIKVGDSVNGWPGNADGVYELTVTKGSIKGIVLDSARFGQMSGSHRGKFFFTTDDATDMKLAAILLP